MTLGDYGHLKRKFKEEFPFYETVGNDGYKINSFLRVTDSISIRTKSLDPSLQDLKWKDVEKYLPKVFEEEKFRRIDSDVGDMRFKKGEMEYIVNVSPFTDKIYIIVYEFGDQPEQVKQEPVMIKSDFTQTQ